MNEKNQLKRKAYRTSWKNIPMPDLRELFSFERKFSKEEFEKISLGLLPKEMEDKWFIFEENKNIYFHRSWTGFCIYQIQLDEIEDQYAIIQVFVNRDKNQYQNEDNKHDKELLNYLIDNLLLKQDTAFPIPNEFNNKLKSLYQHHIVGTTNIDDKESNNFTLFKRLKRFLKSFSQ